MSDDSKPVSRRTVLRSAAGTVPAAGLSGLATADGDDVAKYNVGYSAASGRAAARDAASEVVREYSFDALTVRLPQRAADGLRRRSDVRYVEANGAMQLHAQTLPWGVDRIDADLAPSQVDGTGVDVAVLDTGVDGDHADLAGNLGLGAWVNEGCDTCDYGWGDDEGHGTAVAGIVGAIDDSADVVGVAPEVTIHSVQVCDSLGENGCEHDEIAAGLEWVADQGYGVANMSFGGEQSDVVSDAVAYAAGKGVLMVASAGNDGPCTDCVRHPATEPEVVAVSAVEFDDELWSGSSQGPEVDLAAPTNVETTDLGGGTTFFGGTSAAAPHVSGTAALARMLVAGRQDATNLLLDKAEDVGLSANEQGRGLVDAGAVANEPWVLTELGSVTDFEATLRGELKLTGFASSVDVYFEWGVDGQGLPNTTAKQTLDAAGSFSDTVSGLTCGTTYEYRAVAEASDGDDARGRVIHFATQDCDSGDCGQQIIC